MVIDISIFNHKMGPSEQRWCWIETIFQKNLSTTKTRWTSITRTTGNSLMKSKWKLNSTLTMNTLAVEKLPKKEKVNQGDWRKLSKIKFQTCRISRFPGQNWILRTSHYHRYKGNDFSSFTVYDLEHDLCSRLWGYLLLIFWWKTRTGKRWESERFSRARYLHVHQATQYMKKCYTAKSLRL